MRIQHPAAGCGLTTTEGCRMIARNFRRFPEALERQLTLQLGKAKRPRRPPPKHSGINTGPVVGKLRHQPRPMDAEQVPIGSTVRTPTGKLAVVEGYRGYKRDTRVRLVCRYLEPENKRFDVVQLAPELVVVVSQGA